MRGGRRRQLRLRDLPGPLHRGQPLLQLAPVHARPEALHGLERRQVERHGERGVHDRRVRQHPAGGDVAVLRHPVPGQPQLPDDGQLPAPADLVQLRGAAPRVDPGSRLRRVRDRGELLQGPAELPLGVQLLFECVTQLDQHLDVQGRVAQPRFGQRTGRPVDRRVFLGQRQAQHAFGHRPQAHPGEPGDPAGQLGVEQAAGLHADLGQTRQVLRRRVDDPLGVGEGLAELTEIRTGDRVDQRGAGPGPPQLDQVRPLPVAVAGGPLGIDGDRPGTRRERRDDGGECLRVRHDRGDSLPRFEERDRGCLFWDGCYGIGHPPRVRRHPAAGVLSDWSDHVHGYATGKRHATFRDGQPEPRNGQRPLTTAQ